MQRCLCLLLTLCCLWLSQAAAHPGTVKAGNQAELIRDEKIRTLFYQGLMHMYQFRFTEADQEARQLTGTYSDSPWGYVLKANICWWKMITGEDNDANRKVFAGELSRAELSIPGFRDEEGIFCVIIINSLRSRYSLLQRDYLSMLRLLNQSRDFIEGSEGKEESCEPYLLTRGLFLYFIAAAKEKMGIFSYLLNYRSDKEQGISYLRRLTLSSNSVLKTEGNYFLMKIFYDMEKDPVKAKPYSDFLVTHYPANLVFCYYSQRINEEIYGKHRGANNLSDCKSAIRTNSQLSEAQIKYLSVLLGQKL